MGLAPVNVTMKKRKNRKPYEYYGLNIFKGEGIPEHTITQAEPDDIYWWDYCFNTEEESDLERLRNIGE